MKARSLLALAGTGGSLVLVQAASGSFVGLAWAPRPNPYAYTFDLYAQFDGGPGDFVFAVAGTPLSPLNINVLGGVYYQHVFGTDRAPNPALMAVFPSLEFDTFVTIGKSTSDGDATSLAPGWPGFGPDRLAFDNSGWYVTPRDPQGQPDANDRVLLARLSMNSFNGQPPTPFIGNILVAGFSNGQDFQHYLSLGIPSPAGLPVLAAAALPGSRRRR